MKRVYFDRFKSSPHTTLSNIWSPDEDDLDAGHPLFGLERAWLHDRSGVSAIPAGVYTLLPWRSPNHGDVWAFCGGSVTPFREDCPKEAGRWGCLMHAGNRWSDLEGCLAPGHKWALDDDGEIWIPPPSKKALSAFREVMGYEPLVAYVRWVMPQG